MLINFKYKLYLREFRGCQKYVQCLEKIVGLLHDLHEWHAQEMPSGRCYQRMVTRTAASRKRKQFYKHLCCPDIPSFYLLCLEIRSNRFVLMEYVELRGGYTSYPPWGTKATAEGAGAGVADSIIRHPTCHLFKVQYNFLCHAKDLDAFLSFLTRFRF